MQKQINRQAGFTLVELSIVLIIIGLIVGGVLAGQSLVRSARLQADITNYNKLDAAFAAFNLRFDALAGDAIAARITALASTTAGDGDGTIESAAANFHASEVARANDHLATAGLIQLAEFNSEVNTTNAIGEGIIQGRVGNAGIVLYGVGGQNFVRFGAYSNDGADELLLQSAANRTVFTPEQAQSIDNKLDDGAPNTGLVIPLAMGADAGAINTGAITASGTAANDCLSSATAWLGTNTNGVCALRVRLSN